MQQRVVPDWEYATAYIQQFQIRLSPRLHERLGDRARLEGRSLEDLVIALLEDAVARREQAPHGASGSGSGSPRSSV